MNFVTPQEWMPKSPDAALMDFAIWGSLNNACISEKSTLWQASNKHCVTNKENWSNTSLIRHWSHGLSNVD